MSEGDQMAPTSAARRRALYGFRTGVLILAVTACCAFLGLLGSRVSARMDVTVTRQHRLSPRTTDLLGRLSGTYEVVIAADPRTLDTATWQRTTDVLEAFEHASRNIRVTLLNTGTTSGVADFEALMQRLAERAKPQIDAATAAVQSVASEADAVAELLAGTDESKLGGLVKQLRDLRTSLEPAAARAPNIEQYRLVLNEWAGAAGVSAKNLRIVTGQARETLKRTVGPAQLPPTDDAGYQLRSPLSEAAKLVSDVHEQLASVVDSNDYPAEARDATRAIVATARSIRDKAARGAASLDAIKHPPLLSVARALQQTTAALVIGPPESTDGTRHGGITAIDIDSLLPARSADPSAQGPSPDFRFRAEDLVASAIVSLSSRENPIVVFVHALPRPLGPEFRDVSALADRLHLRGIDLSEWNVTETAEPPSLTRLDPSGTRPVVYISVPTPAVDPVGAARLGRVSTALAKLVSQGKPVLLSVAPSTLPAIGEKDPMVSFLAPLGVTIDSGRPILRQVRTPTGTVVVPLHSADAAAGDHPISQALTGLKTRVLWPLQVEAIGGSGGTSGTTVTPLLTLPASADVWAESEWLNFAAAWPSPPIGGGYPSPDSSRDLSKPSGVWSIATAVETLRPGQTTPQRLVAMGTYGWFMDQFARMMEPRFDPGTVYRATGNLELAEASVYWLAGQDEQIAQSAAAQSVPLIPPLSPAQVSALRWVLIAGLPVGVLVLGIGWRMVRG